MPTRLEQRWYSDSAPLLLRPLGALFGAVAAARRRRLAASAVRLPVPVIVVGNIAVGGTGKTPFTLWLVERLREWGYKPGVIARGYGGQALQYPLRVTSMTDPAMSGDEPALIARRLACPVAVAPQRVLAGRLLAGECDVLVADDGLQHYALARDVEIGVVDGARGLGNGRLLPAGPLREPPARLRELDLVVINGGGWRAPEGVAAVSMQLEFGDCRALDGSARVPLSGFRGRRVHAVAGIGHPERFFAQLRAAGLEIQPHAFPDHHRFALEELRFGDGLPVLMTEKDAVKCAAWNEAGQWCVPVQARLGPEAADAVRKSLARATGS